MSRKRTNPVANKQEETKVDSTPKVTVDNSDQGLKEDTNQETATKEETKEPEVVSNEPTKEEVEKTLNEAAKRMQEEAIAKQKVAMAKQKLTQRVSEIKERAFHIFCSLATQGRPISSPDNRKKFLEISLEAAHDFVKFTDDLELTNKK